MADTRIESKSEFATLTATLKTKLPELKTDANAVKTKAAQASNYDGIDVAGPASRLGKNFDSLYTDFDTVTNNINKYATDILGFDVNDFLASGGKMEMKYEDLFKTDGTMAGNAQVVWNFLKYKGLSDAAAAGVLGNIQAECSFRTTAVGDGGTSYGLIQWHAGRKTNLENWCRQNGYDPSSLQGQLEFLWYESLDPNSHYGKNLQSAGFYNATDATEAAVIFHNIVERSASTQDTVRSVRGGYANKWYNQFNGTGPGNIDGPLVVSSDWNSQNNIPTNRDSQTDTGAYTSTSCGGCGGCGSSSYYSPSATPSTTIPTTSPITPSTGVIPVTSDKSRGEMLSAMEQVKAQKVKLNFGSKSADTSKFKDYPESDIKVTTGHMAYELTDDDIDLLCSIVAASGGKGYDDSLSIISSILNRCETSTFMAQHGVDPIAQATASGQFSGYTSGDFKAFLAGTNKISNETREAVKAALSGIRNHNKTSLVSIKDGDAGGVTSGGGDTTSSGGDLLEYLRESNENFQPEQTATEVETPTTDQPVSDSQQELDDLGIKIDGNNLVI